MWFLAVVCSVILGGCLDASQDIACFVVLGTVSLFQFVFNLICLCSHFVTLLMSFLMCRDYVCVNSFASLSPSFAACFSVGAMQMLLLAVIVFVFVRLRHFHL